MSVFNKLKQQLKIQLQQLNESNGLIKLEAVLPCSIENQTLLSWLKSQDSFPKYYWQNRKDSLTLTTMGAIQTFTRIEEGELFAQKYNLTLVGGMQFSSEATFILPRLLFTKTSNNITAHLMVNTDKLEQEKIIIEQILEKFTALSKLQKTQYTLLETHFSISFDQWEKNINNAIQAIKNNQFNKVVLANATDFICKQKISAYDLLALSQQKNTQCFHFLWQENKDSTFIGSSPERLYQRNQNILYTEALAGTAAVTNDIEQTKQNGEWLLKDPKNILENQFVVDDICLNLKNYTNSIEVGNAELKILPNVQHLRRLIKVVLNSHINDTQCLQKIHPTAAIAGLPREKALPFIYKTENFKRGWYAGTLGYFNTNESEFCVTLRSASITKNKITVYAGAGIVENSTAESEWQEIQRKALAIVNLLHHN